MARAHEVLGGRWTLLIVREILCGSRRFNDIRRGIPRVSRTVLSERLQALVFVGAIARTDGPHGPEYELTEAGQELAMLVSALGTWGQRWLRASRRMRTSIWSRCWSICNGESVLRPCPKILRGAVWLRPPHTFHAAQEDRSFTLSSQPGLSRAGMKRVWWPRTSNRTTKGYLGRAAETDRRYVKSTNNGSKSRSSFDGSAR